MIRTLPQQYRPVCGLHAIALATTDKEVPDIEAFFKPTRGASWKGRLYWDEILEGLKAFGAHHTDISDRVRGLTATKALDELVSSKQHLVFVTGHFFTLKDGRIWDQHYNTGVPLKESRWARKKVRRVAIIEEV